MTKERLVIEEWFFTTERWKAGEECLNLDNINTLPSGCSEWNLKEWLQELTTFVFLYPDEWEEIYREYLVQTSSRNETAVRTLAYFRDDEGNLRREGEQDVFLRLRLEGEAERIERLVRGIEWTEVFTFQDYLDYCMLDCQSRLKRVGELQEKIEQEINYLCKGQYEEIEVEVSFEEDFEDAAFKQSDIYIDALNDNYIIL